MRSMLRSVGLLPPEGGSHEIGDQRRGIAHMCSEGPPYNAVRPSSAPVPDMSPRSRPSARSARDRAKLRAILRPGGMLPPEGGSHESAEPDQSERSRSAAR